MTYASATGAFQNQTVTTNGPSLTMAVNPANLALTVVGQSVSVTLSGSGPNPSQSADALSFNATVSGAVPDGETVLLQNASNRKQRGRNRHTR